MRELVGIAKRILKNNKGQIGPVTIPAAAAAAGTGGLSSFLTPLLGGAAQFGLSSLFGRSNKQKTPNLDIAKLEDQLNSLGDQEDLLDLRKFANQRIGGQGLGFGDKFVQTATNPVAQERLRQLRQEQIPELTQQQASRGIERSSIATSQVARAQQLAQSDISQLMANFFVLNEAQKKKDLSEALGIKNQLFQTENANTLARVGILNNAQLANAGLAQTDQTANRANTAAFSQGIEPLVNQLFGIQSSADKDRDFLSSLFTQSKAQEQGPAAQILGSKANSSLQGISDEELEAMLIAARSGR